MSSSKKNVSPKKSTAPKKEQQPTPPPESVEETTIAPEVEEAKDSTASAEPTKAEVAAKQETKKAEPAPKAEAIEPNTKDPLGRQHLQQVLNDYITNMRPGMGVSEEQGAREQDRLAAVLINNAYGANSDEFAGNMKTLLDTVKENRKGAFNERYAYRFVAGMKVTAERRALFEDLLTLTLTTSDAGVKGAAKQIDVRKLIDRIADEQMAANLQSYYGVE